MAVMGPSDLTARVVASRPFRKQFFLARISDDNIERLIDLAYCLSLCPNEGRFPSLTVFVGADAVSLRRFVDLATISDELSVPLLRRIAPIVSSNHVLTIAEEDSKLILKAIGDFYTDMLFETKQRFGLLIEIIGPGDLRVSEYESYRLRAGELGTEYSLFLNTRFGEWAEESLDMMKSCADDDSRVNVVSPVYLQAIWVELLRRASSLRHGACFVILPDANLSPLVNCFEASCDVGEQISHVFSEPGEKLPKERLGASLRAIAHLSATDGCVVFDRAFRLRSFGGMIESNPNVAIECFYGDTDTYFDHDTIRRQWGARRLSALQLCQACPGAMAFVISQDGDLRAFIRDGKAVRVYDNVSYWYSAGQ